MKKLICWLAVVSVGVFFSNVSFAAEHPGSSVSEHPGKGVHEHPGEKAKLKAGEIIAGIEAYIADVTADNSGVFPLHDDVEGKDMRLTLVRVHKDKVSYIKKEDAYFACTDFVTEDGKEKYDVDFWMKKDAGGKLDVYRTKIHKKNGAPRFMYKNDEVTDVR